MESSDILKPGVNIKQLARRLSPEEANKVMANSDDRTRLSTKQRMDNLKQQLRELYRYMDF